MEKKEEYYVWYDYGIEEGPYDFEKIKDLILEGRLREEDKIWADDLREWKKANEIERLKPVFEEKKTPGFRGEERKKKKILLTEDDGVLRHILSDMLEKRGYDVVIAKDGLEGLRKAFVELPDLIILDIILPCLSGLEVCKRLKKDTRMKDIPIIYLTAKDQVTDKLLGLESGGEIYLTKPFDIDVLLEKIQTLLKS